MLCCFIELNEKHLFGTVMVAPNADSSPCIQLGGKSLMNITIYCRHNLDSTNNAVDVRKVARNGLCGFPNVSNDWVSNGNSPQNEH